MTNNLPMSPAQTSEIEKVAERYFAQYRRGARVLACLDFFLKPLLQRKTGGTIPPPRRILLANSGHLGDIVISTALLPVLHAAFPGVQIGFLCGAWAAPVLKDHPQLNGKIHTLSHWYMDRGPEKKLSKFMQYRRASAPVVKEIRAENYDVGIDLRLRAPDYKTILWKAGIPARIGYNYSSLSAFLTHPLPFQYLRLQEAKVQGGLLAPLGVTDAHIALLQTSLPKNSAEDVQAIDAFLGEKKSHEKMCILHMGSGMATKEKWPEARWQTLAQKLTDHGWLVVFTGRGKTDAERIQRVTTGLQGYLNGCDRLSWSVFVELTRRAQLMFSVDTVAAHVAAALNIPCVIIFCGVNDEGHWRPLSDCNTVAMESVPCAPCFRPKGCPEMTCMTHLTVEKVLALGYDLLQPNLRLSQTLRDS